jgi:hypothetical protein
LIVVFDSFTHRALAIFAFEACVLPNAGQKQIKILSFHFSSFASKSNFKLIFANLVLKDNDFPTSSISRFKIPTLFDLSDSPSLSVHQEEIVSDPSSSFECSKP